jgi:carbon monoxide dehydrogenase subunit G
MKMKKLATAAMIFGTLGLTAGMVSANTTTNRGPVPFAAWDEDSNGTIDKQEFNTMREQRQVTAQASGRMGKNMANAPTFAQIDADGNGLITVEELNAIQQNRGNRQSMGNHHGRGQSMMQGQAYNKQGKGRGHHGSGQALSGNMGPRYQAMDAETRAKHDAFREATADLRLELAEKRAEKQAIMRSTSPDPDQAAQLTRDLLELRSQMMAKAQEAGIEVAQGRTHVNGHGGGARW